MLSIKLSLRISSKTYDLSQLKEALGEPTRGFSKGDLYSNGAKTRDRSLWLLKSSLPPQEKFESHASTLINFLESKEINFKPIKHQCEVDLFCMLASDSGQGGFTFPYWLSEKASRHGLNIVFDVYVDSEDF